LGKKLFPSIAVKRLLNSSEPTKGSGHGNCASLGRTQ
jgi:hypothetical protein